MARCSIVVPVFNRASLTKQCVDWLLAHPAATVETELIVVDDGSQDLTQRLLARYRDPVRVVRHECNAGFATACNDGAMVAEGDYLLFLNNDTQPTRGWLDALIGYAEAHPAAAIVGNRLLFSNDTIQHAGIVFIDDGWPAHLHYGFPAQHPAVCKSRRFQAVTGACMLVRRNVFEAVGGFDTAYLNAYEDVDLCLRVGRDGGEVHYCHDSVVYHLESLTRRAAGPWEQVTPSSTDAMRLFKARWGGVERDALRYLAEDGLVRITLPFRSVLQVSVDAEVASSAVQDNDTSRERLLTERAKQVGTLLDENIRLRAGLREVELNVIAAGVAPDGQRPFTWPGFRAVSSAFDVRQYVAGLYLEGSGLEIGPLHSPIPVRPPAAVRYVDRMSVADLRRQYPELDGWPLVEADIIDDGEHLASIADASQDFVISSHFLEHCQDTIGAVKTMLRVLKPGGIAYVAVPDKNYTFDRNRPVTPFEHLVRDHVEGPEWSRVRHFEEWVTLGEDVNTRNKTVRDLMEMNYSIHFHVWTQAGLFELFGRLQSEIGLNFEIEAAVRNAIEVIFILRKGA